MALPEFHYIGKPGPRSEDYRFLTGHGRYIDDIEVPGALHACFVRSPHAHARITSIDSTAAQGMPGVVRIVTGRELAQTLTERALLAALDPAPGIAP